MVGAGRGRKEVLLSKVKEENRANRKHGVDRVAFIVVKVDRIQQIRQ